MKTYKKALIGVLSAAAIASTAICSIAFAGEAQPETQQNPAAAVTVTETEDELINGGQIFTGNYMDLYNEETGSWVTVSGLSQGGWADENTGEIFTQEGGGGDHFYGNNGTTLVSEWYYNEYLK